MKTQDGLPVRRVRECALGLILCVTVLGLPSYGANRTWIAGNGNFTNPAAWNTGVPGAADTAIFTNTFATYTVTISSSPTVTNVYFQGTSTVNSVTLAPDAGRTLTVASNFFVSSSLGSTNLALIGGAGTVAVTNAAGDGFLQVGQSAAKGTLQMNGGTLIVDTLVATNATSLTNSVFTLSKGTLTILHGSWISALPPPNNRWVIGSVNGGIMTVNMTGGTNLFDFGPTGGAVLGDASGATGIVNVTGAGTVWTNTRPITVGRSWQGELHISGGAKVYGGPSESIIGQANGTPPGGNKMTVSGTNSLFHSGRGLVVGNNLSSNSLTITDGGRVDLPLTGFVSIMTIGDGGIAGSYNTVMVDNGTYFGTPNINASSAVGKSGGSGNQLVVTNSGQATFPEGLQPLIIGQASAATFCQSNSVTVSDSGTLYTLGGVLIGSSNAAFNAGNALNVNAGGIVFVTNGTLTSALEVRNGILTLAGGTLTVDKLFVTNATAGNSVVNLNSGTLATRRTIVSNSTALVVGDGVNGATLRLVGGGHAFMQGLTLNANATLTGSGAITGAVTFASGAALELTIGGTTQTTQYDFINVVGSAAMNGSLNVRLSNGFTPSGSDVFTGMVASVSLSGAFTNVIGGRVNIVNSPDGQSLAVSLAGNKLVLSDAALPPEGTAVFIK